MPDDNQANAPSDAVPRTARGLAFGRPQLRSRRTLDRRHPPKADAELDTILNRVKWVGPGPEPSEDEVMDLVNDEIHALRAERNEDAVR